MTLRRLPLLAAGLAVFGLLGCSSGQSDVWRAEPPSVSAGLETRAEILRRGRLDCSPTLIASKRSYAISENGRYFIYHASCEHDEFIDLVDLERGERVAHVPLPGGRSSANDPMIMRFVQDGEFAQVALADSGGAEHDFATRVRFLEISTRSGIVTSRREFISGEGRSFSRLAWTAEGLALAAYNPPPARQVPDLFYSIEWAPGAPPTQRAALVSTNLSSLAYPDALVLETLSALPNADSDWRLLVESDGVFAEPDGLTYLPRDDGDGQVDGYGRFVIDLDADRPEAEVIQNWPGHEPGSGSEVETVSPDGRFVAVREGGSIAGLPQEGYPCAGHVRTTDTFMVVGRLPCAPEQARGRGLPYRTLDMMFTSDSSALVAVRGNGSLVDIVSLRPWRQTHRLTARSLGLSSVFFVMPASDPARLLIVGERRWALIAID